MDHLESFLVVRRNYAAMHWSSSCPEGAAIREIDLLTFVDEHETEVISGGIFLVDLTKSWCQIKPAKE